MQGPSNIPRGILRVMQVRQADAIQPGWKARARDGTQAGTITEVTASEMLVRSERDRKRTAYVPKELVLEAHDGLVELDLDRTELERMAGLESQAADRRSGSEPPRAAREIPRKEPPGYVRRIVGG